MIARSFILKSQTQLSEKHFHTFQWLRLHFHLQWVQVQSLVGELRSYMPQGVTKKKGKRGQVTDHWSVSDCRPICREKTRPWYSDASMEQMWSVWQALKTESSQGASILGHVAFWPASWGRRRLWANFIQLRKVSWRRNWWLSKVILVQGRGIAVWCQT